MTEQNNGGFLNNFEQALAKLSEFNQNIETTLGNRKRFSSNIINKLQNVTKNVNDIKSKIVGIMEKINGFENQIQQNNLGQLDNDRKIQQLTLEIQNLTQEKNSLVEELDRLRNIQLKIDAMELQLSEEKKRIVDLQNQIEVMTQQASNLSENANQSQQKSNDLQRQREEADQIIKGLQNKIEELNRKLVPLGAAVAAAPAQIERNNDLCANNAAEIQQLQNDNQILSEENRNFVDRLIRATDTINTVVNNLENFNPRNPEAFTDLSEIRKVVDELEQSLQFISNAIQGQPTSRGGNKRKKSRARSYRGGYIYSKTSKNSRRLKSSKKSSKKSSTRSSPKSSIKSRVIKNTKIKTNFYKRK